MLLKSINARFVIPYRPHVQTLPTVDGVLMHANACKGVSENAALYLGLVTVTYSRGFWDRILYRIAIFCAVSYRRFPPWPYRAISKS